MPSRQRAALAASLHAAIATGVLSQFTRHAFGQAVARGVTPHDILSALERGTEFRQRDGALVYALRLHGNGYFYAVVAQRGVVTVSRKGLTRHELRRATMRYGWQR